MFKFLRRLFRSLFSSGEVMNTITTTQQQEVESIVNKEAEVKEMPWFTRKNDLVQEFAHEPILIYSSNFDNDEPIGKQLANGDILLDKHYDEDDIPTIKYAHKGFMVIAFNMDEAKYIESIINQGLTDGLISVYDYNKNKEAEEDQNLQDDVGKIQEDNIKEIKSKTDNNTYVI